MRRAPLAALALALALAPAPAFANPEGGRVAAGEATIAGEGTARVLVTQTSERALIDWQRFSIGAGETTRFLQPGANALAANRVVGGDPSEILGTLEANGRVVLINRNGVVFGALGDDGSGNGTTWAGAAYLFAFTDSAFSGGRLAAVVGKGYTGGRNVDVAALGGGNIFGASVSLNGTGDRLAVGALGDDGADNRTTWAGAVYLFTFTDGDFSGGQLAAVVGKGYTGGNDVDVAALRGWYYFGVSVSLNGTGDRLAVGASGDENHGTARAGAAYLFTFADGDFSGGRLAAVVGKGQTGGSNVDVAALEGDSFGRSVSLNRSGDRLAVGAYFDDGDDNGTGNAGAVYLFTFTDGDFSGGQLAAVVGKGYTGGRNVDVGALDGGDYFGTSVSLALDGTGTRLAVGAYFDDGAGNGTVHSGAVYLFTFTDDSFSGGQLAAVVGKGYAGGSNLDVPALDGSDAFGYSVSLTAAGTRLAVGAPYDDGAGGATGSAGAVYLFTFTDGAFSGGRLAAVVGKRYTGGRGTATDDPEIDAGGGDVDVVALEEDDWFGASVSLNATGDRLAVGAPEDDGDGNRSDSAGAVYLFTFTDGAFSGGRLAAVVGKGYTGGRNIDVPALEGPILLGVLSRSDQFGYSVSLNGPATRLAVGAPGDDGVSSPTGGTGAVYLFTFTDEAFSGGQLAGVVGLGYTGGGNIDVPALESRYYFGASVSLNGSGDRLAVGAPGYDRGEDREFDIGAVYLFTFFDDLFFYDGRLVATVGKGYTGGRNVDVAALEDGDQFGTSVSLNAAGDRLAVGAPEDAGDGNGTGSAGAVYLFTFSDDAFYDGRLAATLGRGYTGGRNFDVAALEEADWFGRAVSLNGTGDRLAVGAWRDDGDDDGSENAGAVYLFTFSDRFFSGGHLAATVGRGYTGGRNVDVAALEENDLFGVSVSLNETGDRLAVGAWGDDGDDNGLESAGAVHLFAFSDDAFSGGRLAATVGRGYTGGWRPAVGVGDVDVAALEGRDKFGASVSLNRTGDRLAVGAPEDAGDGNGANNAGAVYLFAFSDDAFAGGRLVATMGKGYAGGGNVDVAALKENDRFGASVSLNGTGDRLAVGAAGAVYLFTFTDDAFSGGELAATVGKGYTGGRNVDVAALDGIDRFGGSVSLNATGDRLAVGAAGAVCLFTFADGDFSGGQLAAVVGKGYTGGSNVDVAALEEDDGFGVSVSLNASGTLLAVGAQGDKGAGDGTIGAGAVYLFSFTDGAFSGGRLAAIVGKGYMGGSDVDVAGLERYDSFGASVSLNALGNLLAVGAHGDQGAGNGAYDAGAVYLFAFTDDAFSGGRLAATLGQGYAGGSGVDVAALEARDRFGASVSLNGTGDRLAVGATWDDGAGNRTPHAGAVYLFTFTDDAFSGGRLAATVGAGYTGRQDANTDGPDAETGAGDVDVAALEPYDWFGGSVSLNGTGDRLAVGALDDGAGNWTEHAGAVYLFAFTDGAFSGGRLASVVGRGYAGGSNVDVAALEARDRFGASVSLNGTGDRLAVGADYDDGAGNGTDDAGAVYLFTFTDGGFSGGQLVAVVGKGYTGGRNVDVTALERGDAFGGSVSLNGTGDRLAVGADYDDGAGNRTEYAGAVYLFTFADGAFSGGRLAAVVGKRYTGGGNVDVAALRRFDSFGTSVSLDGSGTRLAVGAREYLDSGTGNAGAVYLFTFTDGDFAGGRLAAVVGKGKTGRGDVDVAALERGDYFGRSVSLNGSGTRLAVGALGDDGADNGTAGAGAVYLFAFTDGAFSGGRLTAVVGKGYTGGHNVDVAALENDDFFGSSVSLNGTGERLAVGALGDDGADNGTAGAGAVYLFVFTDGHFSGGQLAAVVGRGYTRSRDVDIDDPEVVAGGGDVDVAAPESGDRFGTSVSLNGSGTRLAVGARYDDGAGNRAPSAGAVYLFTFTDGAFSGGRLAAVVGKGYTGGPNIDVAALEKGDWFGASVSLNAAGDRLAVGAERAGAGNGTENAGAVYLFTFADGDFSGGQLAAVLGKGYTGGSDVDVAALEPHDWFGGSVSLNGTGDRLAVGAFGEAGDADGERGRGAVYLFAFTDGAFSGGRLAAVLGRGYTGGRNIDVAALEPYDFFGRSVSLNGSGTRLAVGAFGDAGADNGTIQAGAVYLFTFAEGDFSGGRLAAVVGKGYAGGWNDDFAALGLQDRFGYTVSLNAAGDRLAVGAWGDDGADNGTGNAGAVYLLTFTDADFSGGQLAAVVGKGYTGGRNVDVAALELGDWFGFSASLNAAGDRLAVGADLDDGAGNGVENAGAVYLFTFTDDDFSGGRLVATVGKGYTGDG